LIALVDKLEDLGHLLVRDANELLVIEVLHVLGLHLVNHRLNVVFIHRLDHGVHVARNLDRPRLVLRHISSFS
jgi:hypothetical protein